MYLKNFGTYGVNRLYIRSMKCRYERGFMK